MKPELVVAAIRSDDALLFGFTAAEEDVEVEVGVGIGVDVEVGVGIGVDIEVGVGDGVEVEAGIGVAGATGAGVGVGVESANAGPEIAKVPRVTTIVIASAILEARKRLGKLGV